METRTFGGAGGIAGAEVNYKTYAHETYGNIEVNTTYQYEDEDVKRISRKIPDELVEAGGERRVDFFIGGVISNDQTGGAVYDNSSLTEEYAKIMSRDDLKGKQVTLAFPNCNNGHWRLFLMQLNPSKPKEARFTICDSLNDDVGAVNAVFHNNIVPIFESCGLKEVFGIAADTQCEMIDLGSQKTGIEGDADHGRNREDCAPRMLKALRLCYEYGVDDLKNPLFVEALAGTEGFPSPSKVKEVRVKIEELQGWFVELEMKKDEKESAIKGCLDEKSQTILSQHIQLLQQNSNNQFRQTILMNKKDRGETVDGELEAVAKDISEVRSLMDDQLSFLKKKLTDFDGMDAALDAYIANEKQIIEIDHQIGILKESELAGLDKQTIEYSLKLRALDVINLAEQVCDEVDDQSYDVINYTFDGVRNFFNLQERAMKAEFAKHGVAEGGLPSLDGGSAVRTDGFVASSEVGLPLVLSGDGSFSASDSLDPISDLDSDFDVDAITREVDVGMGFPRKTHAASAATIAAGGSVAIDQRKRAVVPADGPAVPMVSGSAVSLEKPSPHTNPSHEDSDEVRPASILSSKGGNKSL